MAEIIKMRRMSDTMEEGVIVEWLVKVGDTVKIGDPIAEVETDKATMDFDVPVEGTILHIEAQPGDTVPIDGVVAVIGKKGEDFQADLKAAKESVSSAADNNSAVVEEEKGTEVTSQVASVTTEESIPEVKQANPVIQSQNDGRIKASPLAKKLAAEQGIDISMVNGSGDFGRIVKKDIESFDKSKINSSASIQSYGNALEESYTEVPVSQMRKAIARRLADSKFNAPHFYLTREIDMGRVIEARAAINSYLGSKVSFNDIVIKAAAHALKLHPSINASWMGNKIRMNNHIHIGVATAIDDGLIVPVVKFTDTKSLSAINAEVKELAQKAKDKKLKPEEFSGNTFTISNLGMFGIDEFTAIINSPDACILAIGNIKQQAVVKNGELAVGNIMKVTLSCDHRVVDGATGAKFLQTFAQFLEEPLRILA